MNSVKVLCLLAMLVVVASLGEAHKKFHSQPVYQPERCVCDCQQSPPVLPNRPYYGSGGYHQPRPSGGYGSSGSFATAGSYGSGGGQTSGGY